MQNNANQSRSALTPRQDLYEVFAHSDYSLKKKKKIIDALDDIDGFELAFLISFILSIDITGHLNIISKTNEVIGISFSRGFITHIDLPDRQTYFGTLLVELGYIQLKELEIALKQTEVHIGQYFLKQKKVTQKQIDFTFRRQMELRLSKLISNNTYNINFADAAETPLFIKITRRDYYEMCYLWLDTRFTNVWLHDHFKQWQSDLVIFVDGHTYIPEAFKKPFVAELPDFEAEVRKGLPLSQLQGLYRDHQEAFYKAMYFLSLIGVVVFKKSPEVPMTSKLETIYFQLKDKKGKDLALALSELTRVPAHLVESVYLAFLKLITEHSDDNSQEHKNSLIKIGLEFLSQPSAVQVKKSAAAVISNSLRATMEVNIAKNAMIRIQDDLLKGKYFEAFGQLKKVFLGNEITPSMKVYLLWAKIGHALKAGLKVNLTKYENELDELSNEDKTTAEYDYVRAMLAKLKGDKIMSDRHFEEAVKKSAVFFKYPLHQNLWAKLIGLLGNKD